MMVLSFKAILEQKIGYRNAVLRNQFTIMTMEDQPEAKAGLVLDKSKMPRYLVIIDYCLCKRSNLKDLLPCIESPLNDL
jgi:hypothetical protein